MGNNSKWNLNKHEMGFAYHFTMQYNEWKEEYRELDNYLRSPSMDHVPIGSGTISNPTERIAIKKAELMNKIQTVENTVKEADPELYEWLLIGVTTDYSYEYLSQIKGIPCCRNTYYSRKKKYYYLLAKKYL